MTASYTVMKGLIVYSLLIPLLRRISFTLAGILTERDYARKIVLKGKRSTDTLVSEIMTTADKIVSITEETTIEGCMQKMSGRKIRHLPVLKNGKPVAVISIGDVVSTIIKEQQFTIEAMSNYIQGVNL